jgi:hypothetical protein
MSNNVYDAPMHRNNRAAFLLLQIESESTRAITHYYALLNPFLVSSHATLDSCCPCVLRAYLKRPSDKYAKYAVSMIHISGACRSSLSPQPTIPLLYPPLNSFPLMSQAHPTSTSSKFRLIFDNALKAYRKRTKMDPLTHPLADRLETCDSASSILTVLQEHIQELDESQRNNLKWLHPTVNVLHAFSKSLGEVVGSVCFRT